MAHVRFNLVVTVSYNLFNFLRMKKEITITWVLLLFLTAASALVSYYYKNGDYLFQLILLLAVLKFIGVAFNFMELKRANVFWKIATIVFIILFYSILLIL